MTVIFFFFFFFFFSSRRRHTRSLRDWSSDVCSSDLTIKGSGFAGATAVSFGLVPTTYTVDSPTQITAAIPADVAYGRWRVSNAFGTGASDLVGSVPLPTITGISSQYGAPGSTVTITGSGFSDVTDVTLGFVAVSSYTVASPTSIVATVP